MATTLKKFDRPNQPAWHARFTRRNTTSKRIENQKPPLRNKRARIYSAQLGRFISRDPMGFVDGMNRYRAYFVPGELDPRGNVCVKKCSPAFEDTGVATPNGGSNICFCDYCVACHYYDRHGLEHSIDCPRAICKGRLLNPSEDVFHDFLETICEETLNPCSKICKRLSGIARKICEAACKRALQGGCERLACISVVDGIGGGECYYKAFDPETGNKYPNPRVHCEDCCDRYEGIIKQNCLMMCQENL